MSKKEYDIYSSPFYTLGGKVRSQLTELKVAEGDNVVLAKKRFFKKDEYTKLIINEEFDISAFHSLSKTATTILFYILMYCLDYNSPTFRFKASQFALIIGKEKSVIFKGIAELTQIKYIAKTKTREVYWINHNLFYKGNFIVETFLKLK